MGMRYILPEHIVIALVSSGETGSKQVIDRLGINIDKLKDEAVKRMRGERENDAPQKRKAVRVHEWFFRVVPLASSTT